MLTSSTIEQLSGIPSVAANPTNNPANTPPISEVPFADLLTQVDVNAAPLTQAADASVGVEVVSENILFEPQVSEEDLASALPIIGPERLNLLADSANSLTPQSLETTLPSLADSSELSTPINPKPATEDASSEAVDAQQTHVNTAGNLDAELSASRIQPQIDDLPHAEPSPAFQFGAKTSSRHLQSNNTAGTGITTNQSGAVAAPVQQAAQSGAVPSPAVVAETAPVLTNTSSEVASSESESADPPLAQAKTPVASALLEANEFDATSTTIDPSNSSVTLAASTSVEPGISRRNGRNQSASANATLSESSIVETVDDQPDGSIHNAIDDQLEHSSVEPAVETQSHDSRETQTMELKLQGPLPPTMVNDLPAESLIGETRHVAVEPIETSVPPSASALSAENSITPPSVGTPLVDAATGFTHKVPDQPGVAPTLPIGTKLSQQVVGTISQFVDPADEANHIRTMTMELEPQELGHLRIFIEQSAEAISAQIVATESVSMDLLNSQKESLLESLSELGFEDASVDISHQESDGSESFDDLKNLQKTNDRKPSAALSAVNVDVDARPSGLNIVV